MPKQKKGGKKKKRGAHKDQNTARPLLIKEDGQEYAQVDKLLGNRLVECTCFDGKIRMCKIRGSMRKKCWIAVGDIVIICLRDFQDDKADIIHRYHPDEVRKLKSKGEIPDTVEENEQEQEAFIFENDDDAFIDDI